MGRNTLNLGNALLQQGRQAVVTLDDGQPMAEMPMVLTLDQLRPNPDNPRTSRNPRYDDIKASIKARGLDTVPKVTRDPDGDEVYIFSDGGNTRYQVLSELWQETGDERFYRLHCLFKPWPGRLQCVIGHLAENELRGDLSFIEKALGVCKARTLYEAQKQQKITLRELSALLGEAGFPISISYISRMEDTVQYLYPWIPNLLNSGLNVPQIRVLLALRQDAETVWQQHVFSINPEPVLTFNEVFGFCCRKFDALEDWSPEMFRDELIGDLLQALPHPQLNYDRWILELDPKESNRRQLFGEQATKFDAASIPEASEPDNANQIRVQNRESNPRIITQSVTDREQAPDTESAPVDKTQAPAPSPRKNPVIPPYQPDSEDNPPESVLPAPDVECLHFARTGLEPVSSVWDISPMQDDIEHLQNMAFRLAFELTEVMGCDSDLLPASDESAAGFCLVNAQEARAFSRLLFSLTGENTTDATELTLTAVLLGTAGREDMPLLDDTQTVKFLRLIRVLRRLRELQRQIAPEAITMS
ncbi:ParB family protein [Xenorhabdus bovienii]|uniref:ParB family protein n=1 Tax=Xenorhabdus bovienii TaxID=40576 RepID=UPI00237C7DD3|nr:ParB family protein [Xenorhabdus bovienii]MDE1496574.1 ParB family protein [Xenorhabdus bovienii]MDE9472863.1 ParB family protein [Xenorhabdus bovienii]